MSARVLSESALRVSDCVTGLLRKQPFFGSLVLRLPLRADPTRQTLATDGQEIRYSPRWVAETDAHLIETAMARAVIACVLKHHTRRCERDPERWQMASQLVTHALLRDAGFTLPPDAEAWEDLSVEQAYDRLPDPKEDSGGDGNTSQGAGGADAGAPGQPPPDGDSDGSGDPSDPAGDDADSRGRHDDGYGQDGNRQGQDAPSSHDPSGTGEVMDANARAGDGSDSGEAPVEIAAEEQAWDEAMHQALNIARAEGKVPDRVEETVRNAHASTLDWRTLLRRYMTDAASRDYSWSVPNRRFIDGGLYLPSIRSEGIDAIAIIIDTSGSLPPQTLADFWAEPGEIVDEIRPPASLCSRSTPHCRTPPSTGPTTSPTRSRSRAGAAPTSARASNGSTMREYGQGCASTSRTWSARTTPRPGLGSPLPGSIEARPRQSGTASPGASASTSPPDISGKGGAPELQRLGDARRAQARAVHQD